MDPKSLQNSLDSYVAHLSALETAFNTCAEHVDLPIRMSTKKVIAAVTDGIGLSNIAGFGTRADDTGIIHETQLKTAINCIVKLWKSPLSCGHVVGAMQSGKTTTSLGLQWAGPALYLLTGMRASPLYIIGNQTNHEDQTTIELHRFVDYYGHVELLTHGVKSAANDAVFARAPSLKNYREHVLRDAEQQILPVPQLGDIIHRRVGGEHSVRKIVERCRRATQNGYRPLMIIDEPQFGASDRVVRDDEGQETRRSCVLIQIFDRIEQALGSSRNDHWFVGLSATPFELNDLSRVWEVRQALTPTYSGFNYFNGEPISPDVDVTPPRTLGLSDFATEIDVPFLADVSLSAYDGSGQSFVRHAQRIGFTGTHDEYRAQAEQALRKTIDRVIGTYTKEPEPVGLCIRAFNDNHKTSGLIDRLALDPKKVELIEYFGGDASGVSVKRAIAARKHPELPYIVFVTNRARMADAFPRDVRFFMDFAQKASDLNALLQGLLGRACGYNKRSTVVLSDDNANIVEAYVQTKGAYVHKTSRHSVAVGGFRRGAPTGMLKVRVEMDDPTVQRFFERINAEVVDAHIPAGTRSLLNLKRASGANGGPNFRTGPILRIAEELDLFGYLEKAAIRTALFPEIPTGFKIARRSDTVRHLREEGVVLSYSVDEKGDCRFTFREAARDDKAQGGAAGRAKGKKDVGQHIEPTIYVEKYDPETGEIIPKKANADDERVGRWRAFMVTFPLREPVREVRAATVALPTPTCAYNPWMSSEEQAVRDAAVAPQQTPSA